MTAGSNARYPSSSCARGVIFFAEGDTLFETLVLNLIEYPPQQFGRESKGKDKPAWEMDDPFTEPRQHGKPLGYLDYLTWHSRRVWLETNNAGGNQDQLRVTKVCMSPGEGLPKDLRDTMKHYTPNMDANRKKEEPWLPMRFREGRALWRDSYALFKKEDEKTRPPLGRTWLAQLAEKRWGYLDPTQRHKLRVLAFGMASDKADQIFWRCERMPLPLELLTDDAGILVGVLSDSMTKADDVARGPLRGALNQVATELLDTPKREVVGTSENRKGKSKKNKSEEGKADKQDDRRDKLVASWNTDAHYWAQLEPAYWNFVDKLLQTTDLAGREAVRTEWHGTLRREARAAFETTIRAVGDTPRALKAAALAQFQLAVRLNAVLGKLETDNEEDLTELQEEEE